jgi:hypothetical protein
MSGPFTRRGQGWHDALKAVTALSAAMASIALASPVRAAGSAYVVDTSEVTDAGACKIESWFSTASKHDFFGATNPACGVNLYLPAELSTQLSRARSDGEWSNALTPKAKFRLIPTAIGTPGLAISGTAGFDVTNRENTFLAVTAPVTLRLSNVVRINLNGGWMWDRTVDRHYLTYGAGVDWRTADNIYTLTAEIFGQVGSSDRPSVTQPRFQVGMRLRPIDAFSVDVIYGRNIMGENANWFTIANTIRFAAE